MGVMPCHRKGCDNIMCDTYIVSVGHICDDCQREFKDYLLQQNIEPTTERQITEALKVFMSTERNDTDNKTEITVEDFFTKHTRR